MGIFHSTFIGRAGAKNKGRISRYLANKCSIASRIDCFSETSTEVYGNKLREQVEGRLKFYESGDIPRKNVEVMQEAILEAKSVMAAINSEKKKKSENGLEVSALEESVINGNGTETEADKTMDMTVADASNGVEKKKKKKKKKAAEGDESVVE